ncbi:hypothetical protein WNY37_12925 [Henriciella sp. AS95]|uniref:hypothetical protein n=1 Tax=Henriciella sp. AS95 TaxID=3135782 RepID=UPI00317F0F45
MAYLGRDALSGERSLSGPAPSGGMTHAADSLATELRHDAICNRYNRRAGEADGASTIEQMQLLDWIESQCSVTRVWLDRLIAAGDPDDMVSLIHRQAAWLELVRDRLENH